MAPSIFLKKKIQKLFVHINGGNEIFLHKYALYYVYMYIFKLTITGDD